jgi:4-hydroxyphenylpyruvate dioxygenase
MATKPDAPRIRRLEGLHYYVRDLERSRRFYTERLDFAETGACTEEMAARGKQRSLVFEAASVRVIVSQPEGEGGRAARWLRKHPDGVGTVIFEVEDIDHTFRTIEARGGTPISDPQWLEDDYGKFATFSITTPFGGSTFRFVQRDRYRGLYPGIVRYKTPRGGRNQFGFLGFDHITSNFETMAPALLWMEHVMGWQRFWNIQFHTDDVAGPRETGSGLRSTVMWDPHSGVKFANNEPLRPHFRASQINIFHEDQRGDGIQHAALSVADIVVAVRGLRERGVKFMPTPGTYYDMVPARLEQTGVKEIDEDLETLRELEILVDGDGYRSYLLQIFLMDSAGLYGEREAGPFFYEIIQRKGSQGFGGGNFRALFESIERQHRLEGRIGA